MKYVEELIGSGNWAISERSSLKLDEIGNGYRNMPDFGSSQMRA